MRSKDSRCATYPRIATALLIFGFLILAATGTARASDIVVPIDEARLVPLDKPASDVIIGNPSIADVAVQSGQRLVVTGKSFGITNLIVLDARGEEIMHRNVRVRSSGIKTVRIHKGPSRYSYDCPDRCETTLVPGDNEVYFTAVTKEVRDKMGVAQSVLEGDAASGQ